MTRRSRFSQEVRERAVRMVVDQRSRYGSQWETIRSIAEKIGCSAETLRKWVRQIEVDSGLRGGGTKLRGRDQSAKEPNYATTSALLVEPLSGDTGSRFSTSSQGGERLAPPHRHHHLGVERLERGAVDDAQRTR